MAASPPLRTCCGHVVGAAAQHRAAAALGLAFSTL
jgi:hypothetical protein